MTIIDRFAAAALLITLAAAPVFATELEPSKVVTGAVWRDGAYDRTQTINLSDTLVA
jgi:hypothetical protein